MKQRLINILLGAILGAMLVQAIPSGAHSGSSEHLWNHIRTIKGDIATLKGKTQQLRPGGEYVGRVSPYNIDGPPIGCDLGDPAIWRHWLDCPYP